jgi:hypothetical protein
MIAVHGRLSYSAVVRIRVGAKNFFLNFSVPVILVVYYPLLLFNPINQLRFLLFFKKQNEKF